MANPIRNGGFFFLVLVIFLASAPHPAFAATTFQITGLAGLNLGSWNGSSNMTGNDAVCVYKSSSPTTYHVTGTDTSTITPGSFNLENAAHTKQIPYTLDWSNTPSPGTLLMSDGIALSASGANKSSQTCSGGNDANYSVTITATSLPALPAGVYTTTVTFVVGP